MFVDCLDVGYLKEDSLHVLLRSKFEGMWIANGGFDEKSANQILLDGHADMVAFGNLAVANNDLPQKF